MPISHYAIMLFSTIPDFYAFQLVSEGQNLEMHINDKGNFFKVLLMK